MQGKVPWNKGKKLSLETRVRMSLAKQGRTYSRTTRRSMSRAHLSLSHSPVRHTAFQKMAFAGQHLHRPLHWLRGVAAGALQALRA